MTREEAINEIKSWAIPSKKGREVLETLIPELRESEDEKIKSCIGLALTDVDEQRFKDFGTTLKDCLAWLEKQKEPKSIESIAAEVTKDKESAIEFLKSAGIMDDNGELAEIYRSEQKPADYDHEMWKNCETNFEGGKKEVIDHPEKYGLQKPAEWSEEDKDYYDTIVRKLEVIGDDSGLSNNQIKFLREHCPLHRSEWSEEDETIIEGACSALEIHGHTKLASMLKSLRLQSQGTYKLIVHNIYEMLKDKDFFDITPSHRISLLNDIRVKCKDADECAEILDVPSLKPSEEQMYALAKAVTLYDGGLYSLLSRSQETDVKYRVRYEKSVDELMA